MAKMTAWQSFSPKRHKLINCESQRR